MRWWTRLRKPTAAICHGPIALLSAQSDPASYQTALVRSEKPAAKDWIYQGYRMTIFADPEEQVFESSLNGNRILFYPARAMEEAGGDMTYTRAWSPNVVVDRELITGQNPFSDHALAKTLVQKLESSKGSVN